MTKEFIRSENCDDRFLALLRNNGDLHLAFLDVEDRIGRGGGIALDYGQGGQRRTEESALFLELGRLLLPRR